MAPKAHNPRPDPFDSLSPEALASIGLTHPSQRATGPKTKAGKAKSRANAVKPGMRCQIVEPPAQGERIAERIEEWIDAVQRGLVARAATASVRYESSHARELQRNLNGFSRARRESEAHTEAAVTGDAGAPNELQNGQNRDVIDQDRGTSANDPAPQPASPAHPERVARRSPERVAGVAGRESGAGQTGGEAGRLDC